MDKNLLINLYTKQKLSTIKIGKLLNCSNVTIGRYLKKYNINRLPISEWNKLRKITEITRNKLKKARIGRRPMLGKRHTVKTKLKIGLTVKLILNTGLVKTKMRKNHRNNSGINHPLYGIRGKDSPNYNKNITEEERTTRRNIYENDLFRKGVFKRDNYTCQNCNDNKGHNLEAHHLEGYHWCKELRFNIFNGVCLCKNCHKKFHKRFGYLHNTTKQFVKFIISEVKYYGK